MANYDYYVVQGKTLDNIAETMKTALGVNKDTPIRFNEITSSEKTEQITENINTQTEVIEQIKVALNGKSGVGVKEIVDIIDQSGVLDSTDGTATEKVEMLTHYVDIFKKAYKLSYYGIKSIENIDFYIDFVTFELDFQYSSVKTMVGVDVSKLTTCRTMFSNCRNLVSIQRPFDMSSKSAQHMAGMFSNCFSLVDVHFVAETIKESISFAESPLLSAESIQSIIGGLVDLTDETAQTLTLHADVKAKLTEGQLATITSKNWNLA